MTYAKLVFPQGSSRSRTRGAVAGLVALAAIGCGQEPGGVGSGDAPPGRLPTMVVGYSALRISLPVFVAESRGLFERHGLDVELRRYETAQPLVEEVLDGRIAAGGFAALPIVMTAAAADDSEVRIAAAMVEDSTHPVSYLLRRASDDSLTRPGDLSGHRIGILPTVAYERWLDTVLESAGVDPDEVTVLRVAPPQQAQMLEGGGVDALFTNDPMATAALATGVAATLGEPAPVPRALGGPLVFGAFLIHPRTQRERPRDTAHLIAAIDEAIGLIEADQDAARRDMQPFVRAPERAHVMRYPPARYRSSRAFDDAALRHEVSEMRRLGILTRAPATDGWVISAPEPAE